MPEQLPHFGVAPPTCPCCGTQISVHQKFNPGHCGATECNSKYAVAAALRREAKRKKELQDRVDAATLREADAIKLAADVLQADLSDILVATVPFQNNPIKPPSPAAREALISHIEDIVALAFEEVSQTSGDALFEPLHLNTPTPVEAAGCLACRGNCCSFGLSNKAFLNASVIKGLFLANPEMGIAEVINHYIAALPEKSVEDACLYQSSDGCTLSRGWRSNTCNSFRCYSLVAMSERALEGEDLPFAIVAVGESDSRVLAHRESLGTKSI